MSRLTFGYYFLPQKIKIQKKRELFITQVPMICPTLWSQDLSTAATLVIVPQTTQTYQERQHQLFTACCPDYLESL